MSVSVNKTYSAADLKFLNLLSEKFPTIADATTEIINLEAILNLPKGTEHFLTDLHGEYEAFRHVLKNASGVIRQKVHEVFNNTLRESEMTELCTLIYYPAEKLQLIKQKESNLDDWYKVTLNQLTEVCRAVSVKYTRSKVRKMLPPDFSYVIQELLHESDSPGSPKQSYFNGILNSIISIGRADAFIIAMSNVIQCLTIDRLHIVSVFPPLRICPLSNATSLAISSGACPGPAAAAIAVRRACGYTSAPFVPEICQNRINCCSVSPIVDNLFYICALKPKNNNQN